MKQLYVETYGCQMNKLDSELATQALSEAGFVTTEKVEDADLIVLNTCSVRDQAEHRVVSQLGRLKPGGGKRKPGAVLALIGCMGQRQGEDLFKLAPHLDIVAGTKEFTRLPELYQGVQAKREQQTALDLSETFRYARDPKHRSAEHQAYVSIMRGCDLFCTYCIVPSTRGPEESKPLATIVEEVQRLVDDGVVEGHAARADGELLGQAAPGRPGPGRPAGRAG
ncbi:MAG: radical SAM protein [Planctomycetota bacterium]